MPLTGLPLQRRIHYANFNPDSNRFYWEQLGHDNSARQKKILSIQAGLPAPLGLQLSDQIFITMDILEGQQSIAKFNTEDFQVVHIFLACIRLKNVGSDLLITWNDPDGVVSQEMFHELVDSLCITDWGLFAATELL